MNEMRIVTSSGTEGAIEIDAVEAFRTAVRGDTLVATDDGYDETRVIWNGMMDKKPALIVRCSGVADVIDAVNFARAHDLLVAVHGGGHNVAGTAVCEGGIMIDLSPMNGVRVDIPAGTVRAEGGATWGDVDRETQAFGLATPGGVVSMTGIAGLTLCGGLGWLRRKHGLSCDALVSVDVVTADGKLVTASEAENGDLFWGVRGGGGNFGVVTSFEFRVHPVGPMVTLCAPFYPLQEAASILPAWRDFMATAPEEFSSNFLIWSIPPLAPFPEELQGKPFAAPVGVYIGPPEKGEALIEPLRDLGTPLVDLSGPMPYVALQGMFDPFFAEGARLNYWKSLYLNDFGDEVIEDILDRAAERPSPWVLFAIWHLGGAVSRVGAEDTAFGDRSAPYLLSIDSSWTDPGDTDQVISWTREFWTQMMRFSSGGIYLNFPGLGEEGEALLRASYGDANYDRLVALKNKYDPTNLFRMNLNVKPSV